MIDEKILDEIVPVPERNELKDSIERELMDEGFIINNFSSGGIFYTIMMILIQCRIELVKLLRKVLSNMFIAHAEGVWLELKANDFSKKRKQPSKTKGYVTLKRTLAESAIKIYKGDIFKTERDINGEELRYLVTEDTVIKQGIATHKILVEAEKEGTIYNVPIGQIKKSLTHIEGIDEIVNEDGWLVKEGTDLEDTESLRSRVLNSWAELSTLPIRDKYKNVCEAVEGVLFVNVDDMHPRGQGTVDIVVTSVAGVASDTLLNQVKFEAEKIKGPYDNLLIKSSIVVEQNVEVTLIIPEDANETGLEERAKSIILDLFKIKKDRELNKLYKDDIIFELRKNISVLKSVKVITPVDDVILSNDKVIILGTTTINIQRG